MRLTREEFIGIVDAMVSDKVDGVRAGTLAAHDAELRARLAQVEQERDSAEMRSVAHLKLYRDCSHALAAKDVRIAELEHERVSANQLIVDLVPLAPITEADVQWAKESLEGKP